MRTKPKRKGREIQLMSAKDFAALMPLVPRNNPQRIELARKHLVDGITQQQIANENGCSRQNVSGAVKLVRDAAKKLTAIKQIIDP